MGCCVSTNKDSKFNKVGSESPHESRAPPPSSLDQEETVKEVLSETPKLKPPPAEPVKSPVKEYQQHQDDNYTGKTAPFQPATPALLDEKIEIQESRYKNEKMFQEEEIFEQEVSEVCSLSLSEKPSTTTIDNGSMDCDDCDDEEVQQRVGKSPAPTNRVARDLGAKRDRPPPLVARPQTWLTDQSWNRRNSAVSSGQSKELEARRGLRSNPNRRDPGESSGRRRSRSPATHGSTPGGRSPPAGKANQSPGRVRTDPPECGGDVTKMGGDGSAANSTTGSGGTGNESLKNPHVSLECFIFL